VSVEWTNRTTFAPYAEALGINTDWIMSAVRQGDVWLVLYTEGATAEPDEMIWAGVLRPDTRGILQVVRRSPFKTIGEFNEGLDAHMRRAMEGRDDGAV
jgi:hypothetical protein